MNRNYFRLNNNSDEQKSESLSPKLTEIFMNKFEHKAIKNTKHKIDIKL